MLRYIGAALLVGLAPAKPESWVGSYVCPQGQSGLALHLERNGPSMSGVFHFYPPPGTTRSSEGCFEVTGRSSPEGVTILAAGRWLFRPAGYVAVDLEGRMIEGSGEFSGNVRGSGCTTFRLRLQAVPPALPAVCRTISGPTSGR